MSSAPSRPGVTPARSGARILFQARDLAALRPDAATDRSRYRAWVADRGSWSPRAVHLGAPWPRRGPEITFLLAGSQDEKLEASLASLWAQDSSRWRALVAVARPSGARPGPLGARRRRFERARRVGWVQGPEDLSTAAALERAFVEVETSFVAVLDAGDVLAPGAVRALTGAIDASAADLVYGDEDEVGGDGEPGEPRLKPDWSPDLLLACPYLGRPLVLRRRVVAAAGGLVGDGGPDWEHDLMLRAAELAESVGHVAEVLCRRRGRRPHDADLPPRAGDAAPAAALARRGERGTVAPGPLRGTWRVARTVDRLRSVGVVIPFRDEPRLLRACVDSIRATQGSTAVHLLLVDNGSSDPETVSLVERLEGQAAVTVRHDPRPFNWAALNNAAANGSDHDVLVFLNNDVEAIRPGWLDVLVAHALRPEIAAAGPRLLYPDGRVQHVGVVVGLGGAAGHVLAGLDGDQPGYLGMAQLTRECSAVTGACLATRRSVFDELGGFDESLGLDLNDVDYCLRAAEHGRRVIVDPAAELVHHESPSRGTSGSVADISRFTDRWEERITAGDPFLNANLTRLDSSCALRDPGEESWWLEWRRNLGT